MRNLLLFGPFLWFRRVVLWILVLLLVLVLILYLIANSSLAIKKAVDTFAPDYNITYESIKGNALTGFEIKNPQYNHQSIAKKLTLKWNPNTLATKEVTISKLHLKDANIDVIKALSAQFGSQGKEGESEENTTSPFEYTVDIKDISLSTQPFEIEGIAIKNASLESKAVQYKNETLQVDGFGLNVESNITTLSVAGQYKENVIHLSDVKVLDLNVTALEALLASQGSKSEQNDTAQVEVADTTPNPLMPRQVDVDNVELTLLPYNYDPVELSEARLLAKEVTYDMSTGMVQSANVELNATSNLTSLQYAGEIENNHLLGEVTLKPQKALYDRYEIPLRPEALPKIVAKIDISDKKVLADIDTQGKRILQVKEGDFNVDIDDFTSHVNYVYSSGKLVASTDAMVTTPYAKNIAISNNAMLEDGFRYQGSIYIAELQGIDANLTKPLSDLNLTYQGDSKGIETVFTSDGLKGSFNTADFKDAQLHIETRDPLALNALTTLPKELQEARANVVIDAPLNLKNLSKVDAKVKIDSNVVNMYADVQYADSVTVDGKIIIPQKSLIKAYNSDVAWDTLSPIDTHVTLKGDQLDVVLDAENLKARVGYNINSGYAKGHIDAAGLAINIDGNSKEKLTVKTRVTSFKDLGKRLNTLYPVGELPPVEGIMDVAIVSEGEKGIQLRVQAPKLTYKADRKTKHLLKDVTLNATFKENTLYVNGYNVVFNKQRYFATKQAKVELGDMIKISDFWINDELKVAGHYVPKQKQGKFTADAKRFHIKDKGADIQSAIQLNATLDGNDTTVEGKVTLLKGRITPDLESRSFATDSDIIIVQEMSKSKKSPFMDNLTLRLTIDTMKPLIIRQNGMHIKLKPDFTINKEKQGELLYLGSVDLIEGSSYIFQEKKFVLAKSAVYFTGDVNKPLLDIKAKYKALNHLITIAVTGTPTEPNINFSSSPSLTREQILSVILFDTEAGGDTHSGSEMMRMMGGAMAKAALSDVGVKVDHLAFGEGNSIEVGKKLSSKTMVIYINGEIPKVKLKYQHNKRTESVIGVSEESQSYDIIYKRDF